jgi:hypothetical protein
MHSGLGSDQLLAAARVFTALFLRSDGLLPKFPFSGIGHRRNYEIGVPVQQRPALSQPQLNSFRQQQGDMPIGVLAAEQGFRRCSYNTSPYLG